MEKTPGIGLAEPDFSQRNGCEKLSQPKEVMAHVNAAPGPGEKRAFKILKLPMTSIGLNDKGEPIGSVRHEGDGFIQNYPVKWNGERGLWEHE
ncbi:MAG: hypothetical protein WAZ27_00120 [Minisyncoccia bacterium]